MHSKGLQCLRYFLFFVNLLIFIGGVALLAIGIWAYVNGNSFRAIVSESPALLNSVIIIIIIGVVLILAGFFGCLGAIKESRCLLGTFFTIILILFIVELVIIILVFVYYPKAEQFASDSIENLNITGPSTPTSIAWNSIQSTFECCGFNSSADWPNEIPGSCCGGNSTSICSRNSTEIYTVGCDEGLRSYFWVIGGAAIGVLVFELLSMIISCCLYRGIGKYEAA